MFKIFRKSPRPVVAALAAARLTPGSPQNQVAPVVLTADPAAWVDNDHRVFNR